MKKEFSSFWRGMSRMPLAVIALVFATCATAACGNNAPQPASRSTTQASQDEGKAERYIVKTGSIDLEVDDIDLTVPEMTKVIVDAGGYVEYSRITGKDRGRIVARVPADKLEPTMNALASLGSLESRTISSEDVTEQYVDLEMRLKNNVVLRDRLKALLSRATKVEEILHIETELARVQSEVESHQAKLNRLRSQVQLSHLTISLERKRLLGPLGYLGYGLWWVLKKLFVIR